MPVRRDAVRALASAARVAILCLQETKLDLIDRALATDIAGPERQDFIFLPALGTRGGVAIFWDAAIVSLTAASVRQFSITATVTSLATGTAFLLTSVYGPSTDDLKQQFLDEMIACKPPIGTPWLILGDFNMIY